MEVNFDNLRLMLQDAYNDLVISLENRIQEDSTIYMDYEDVLQLEAKLVNLHNYIATVMCVYGGATINNISNQASLKSPNILDEE